MVILPYVGGQICILALAIIAFFLWRKPGICHIGFVCVNSMPYITLGQNISNCTFNKPDGSALFYVIWLVATIVISMALVYLCWWIENRSRDEDYDEIEENSDQQATV